MASSPQTAAASCILCAVIFIGFCDGAFHGVSPTVGLSKWLSNPLFKGGRCLFPVQTWGSKMRLRTSEKKPATFCLRTKDLMLPAVTMGMLPVSRRAMLGGSLAVSSAAIFQAPSGSNAANPSNPSLLLPSQAYVVLKNGIKVCRLQTGLLQLSPKTRVMGAGPEDYWESNLPDSLASMKKMVDAGFTTFDMADVYGPAEDYVGAYIDAYGRDGAIFNTKWIPTGTGPKPMEVVRGALDKARSRMHMPELDIVQFYWWDYDKKNYLEMLDNAQVLKSEGLLRGVSVTGMDTAHVSEITKAGVDLTSVQASYSVIDTRVQDGGMAALCAKEGIAIFAHGALMGGFLSDEWVGKAEPSAELLPSSQLRKYYKWIKMWGDWDLFQEMLMVLGRVADRHGRLPIASIALSWVLQQQAVASVIIGSRPGGNLVDRHMQENALSLGIILDKRDLDEISSLQNKGKKLISTLGDVGDEFHIKNRRKSRVKKSQPQPQAEPTKT